MLYFMEYEPMGNAKDKKTEHTLGRRLLAYGLWEEYGKCFQVEQEEGKKPYLLEAPDIYFNISHTKGLVVCAISDREIGVDAEYIREAKENVVQRVCSQEEKEYIFRGADSREEVQTIYRKKEINTRFTRIWTLKESYIKAIGKGLAFPLKEVSFSLEEKEEIMIASNLSGWKYRQFVLGGKYIVSICEKDVVY